MKPGLRPRPIGQIFAPVPAARSRCLSAFVAIARQNLPFALRYEASHILAIAGVAFLLVGFFFGSVFRFGGTMVAVGWGTLCLALLAIVGQGHLIYGKSRARLIRQLDEIRRSVGLDSAILPESLEFLEATAQQWERIEHAMQAQVWHDHELLRDRINIASHAAMEDILVLECGNISESGISGKSAGDSLMETAANLKWLGDQVDATGPAITTYRRDAFDSNGMSPNGVIPEIELLEEALRRLGQTLSV